MVTCTSRSLRAVPLLLALAACNSDRLQLPNYQNPTPAAVLGDPIAALNLEANGILYLDRNTATGYISGVGQLGRESYNYTASEGRNASGFLSTSVNDQTSFGGVSNWNGFYQTLRSVDSFLRLIDKTPDATLSPDRKAGARGFAHTMEALELLYLISTRHNLGIPVQILEKPDDLAPFVSRDSAYNYIASRLDLAKTELQAGGPSFFFTLHSGFTGFTTPATFLKFNRALSARVQAYRASLGVSGCGAARSPACYQTALAALSESFLGAAAPLSSGVFRVYSSAANDVANGISRAATQFQVAHDSIAADVQLRADGSPDLRLSKVERLKGADGKIVDATGKAIVLNAPGSGIGIPTRFTFTIYPARETPTPIIRNEELVLLRAEARYFTGDVPGALSDLNSVRVTSGGLAPLAGFADADAFISALLYERRYSLLWEGHRWVDVRRFGRLATLPLDLPSHVRAEQLPVPQAECLQRVKSSAALKGPGCS